LYAKKRYRSVQHFIDRAVLHVPVIGPILKKAAIARYARTLATTFAAGVPLVEALDSVAGATGNIVYETGVRRIRDEVATGQRLQRAMEATDLFPNMEIEEHTSELQSRENLVCRLLLEKKNRITPHTRASRTGPQIR